MRTPFRPPMRPPVRPYSEPIERDDEDDVVETAFVDAVLEETRAVETSPWLNPYARPSEIIDARVPETVAKSDGPRVWSDKWGAFEDEVPDFLLYDDATVLTHKQLRAQRAANKVN